GVVKEDDAVATRDVFEEELLELRVVILLDGVVVDEVLLGRGREIADDGKGVAVEVEVGLAAADVMEEGLSGTVAVVPAGGPFRIDCVVGGRVIRWRGIEVQGCADVAAGDCIDGH
ncbi:hypothetical protein CH063_14876, partial [Colletotrichum higginsianum]